MRNVKFAYLYRDGSNFKKFGDIVFQNPDDLALPTLRSKLQRAFGKDGFFLAHHVRVPELFLYGKFDSNGDDHCYHEFYSLRQTADAVNDAYKRSIREFVLEVESNGSGEPFDPFDRFLLSV